MPTRRSLLASLAAGGTLGTAACLGDSDGDGDGETPTAASPTTASPTTASPTTTPTPEPTTVEYVLRVGKLAEAFDSATVTGHAVFVDETTDLGPCYPDVYTGPYQPTITPLSTPTGACHRQETFEVDLAALDGDVRLGPYTVPGSASGHALVAAEVVGTDPEGDPIEAIYDTGGAKLMESNDPPDGVYGVELSLEAVEDDRRYDYWFITDRFDPSA